MMNFLYKDIEKKINNDFRNFSTEYVQMITYSKYQNGFLLKYLINNLEYKDLSKIFSIKSIDKVNEKNFNLGFYLGIILIDDKNTYEKLYKFNRVIISKLLIYCLENYEMIRSSLDNYFFEIETISNKYNYLFDLWNYVKDCEIENINIIDNIESDNIPNNLEDTLYYYDPNTLGKLLIFLYKCKIDIIKTESIMNDEIFNKSLESTKPLYDYDYDYLDLNPEIEGFKEDILKYIRYKDLTYNKLIKKINIFENLEVLNEVENFYQVFISVIYNYIKVSVVNYQILEWFFLLGIYTECLNDEFVISNIFKLLLTSENDGIISDLMLNNNMFTNIKRNILSYPLKKGDSYSLFFLNHLDDDKINKIFEDKFKLYKYIYTKIETINFFNNEMFNKNFLNIISKYSPSKVSINRIINESKYNVEKIYSSYKNTNTYKLVSSNKPFIYFSNDLKIEINPFDINNLTIELFNKNYIKYVIYEIISKYSIYPKNNIIEDINNKRNNIYDISNIIEIPLDYDKDTYLQNYISIIEERLNNKNKYIINNFLKKYGDKFSPEIITSLQFNICK